MTELRPFIIYALPRSRTLWLSKYLTYGDIECHHDTARWMRSVEDVRSWLSQERVGTVETAAAPWWRLIRHLRPNTRVMTIRRPPEEVIESLMRIDMRGEPVLDRMEIEHHVRRLDACLDRIEREYLNCLSVSYDELSDEAYCGIIFTEMLPYRFDPDWWSSLKDIHVSGNVPALSRYFRANETQINRTIQAVGRFMRSTLLDAVVTEADGVTIQEEPLDVLLRDGRELFADHAKIVGESPESWLDKNIPLGRQLNAAGLYPITTARSNGKMFGYLATLIGPSLESPDIISATHTLRYSSPEIVGLGFRIQVAADRALQVRGVHEIIGRAGVRGSGRRLHAMYRRLGYEPIGELYRLRLGTN